jgi:SAM-dependent methyltransferase
VSDYEERTYGEHWASLYDGIFASVDEDQIDLLESLAGDPPRALELGIGTGRLALPLAGRGAEVTGIDISDEMVAKLQEKPGGEQIEVVMGDFAEVGVEGSFPLIYLAFNTLFGLLDQERQIACFHNVAAHLEPGGRFVLDCFVPDMTRFDKFNKRIGAVSINSTEEHDFEISVHRPSEQRVDSHHVRRLADGDTVVLPVSVRYAWPTELDLMGRLAGLELENRWEWYDRTAYTDSSSRHVSVYRKPG